MKIDQFIQKSILLSVGSCYQALFQEVNAKLKHEACTFLESIILISIFFEPEESVMPSVLAVRMGTTRGNISHCVSSLEKAGLIKRLLDSKDARCYRLLLRPEGKRKALRLMKIIDQYENALEASLGKVDTSKLIKLLQGLASKN